MYFKNAMSSPQPADFALIPGAVAWARRDSPSASGLWWPAILYPTWSSAAKDSGLMDLSAAHGTSGSKQGTEEKQAKQPIPLVGVKRPVNLSYLRANKVPMAVVLRPRPPGAGPMARPGPQNRVVAHFLGLSTAEHVADSSVAAWGAVDMASLRPYRRDCHNVLAACRGKVEVSEDWFDLLRAMDEASVVLEDRTVASKELLRNVPEEKQPVGGNTKKASGKSALLEREAAKEAKDIDSTKNDDDKNNDNNNEAEEASLGQTPEFYDDWKSGITESQSQRNTQFSQVFNFSQAQSYGEQEAATDAKVEAASADVVSIEMNDKKNASSESDSQKNGDGEEDSVATAKATNVVGSGDKNPRGSDSISSNEEEKAKDSAPSIAEEHTTTFDAASPTTTTVTATVGMETMSPPTVTETEKEVEHVVCPTDIVQDEKVDEIEEREEQGEEVQNNEEENKQEEEEEQTILPQKETKGEGEKKAKKIGETGRVAVSTTTDNAAAEFSDAEELSEYGPESQDISDMDTQPHSNLTDPACIISPKDGAPKNFKRRCLASILGRKTKTRMSTTTATPFVSSKGSAKKVSPSPMADIAADSATGSTNCRDEEIDEGLESKRLFEGNANASEKRSIKSVGCEGRDVNAKKLRGEDEAYYSAEELDGDEEMHFFTQQA